MSEQAKVLLPEIMVFAGPNGSGKSTITSMAKTVGIYINADDIKKANNSHLEEGLQFIDNLCSVIRLHKSKTDKFNFYTKIEKFIKEI